MQQLSLINVMIYMQVYVVLYCFKQADFYFDLTVINCW